MRELRFFPLPNPVTAIYASPRQEEGKKLWHNLSVLASLHDLPWLITGDLNELLTSEDKMGVGPFIFPKHAASESA